MGLEAATLTAIGSLTAGAAGAATAGHAIATADDASSPDMGQARARARERQRRRRAGATTRSDTILTDVSPESQQGSQRISTRTLLGGR